MEVVKLVLTYTVQETVEFAHAVGAEEGCQGQ